MKVLLDTHVLLWWLEGGSHLSPRARNLIQNRETTVFVSAASAWEIAIKSAAGCLQAEPLVADFQRELDEEGFAELPIFSRHAIRAGLLKGPQKDPFDRMLAAQAEIENLPIISKDKSLNELGVRRIW